MRITLVSALLFAASAACRGASPYTGPPPEYEPPRPGTVAEAGATRAADEGPPPYGTAEELAARVDAFMAGYGAAWGEAWAPSGVLVVARNGEPVLVRSYGKADRASGAPFTIDTRLRIGSLTKQFTAGAVMKLAERGALQPADSVRKWLKELPDAFEPITLHHLLGQTSGVPSYTDDASWLGRKSEQVPEAELLAWIASHPPDHAPGARFSYSNSNYYLLGVVASRAAKKPLAELLAELLFTPAALTATGLDDAGLATGYVRDPSGALRPADRIDDSLPQGAGFLRSSASDLLRWDRALAGEKLLSKASKAALFAPGSSCPACGSGDYAYGWIVDRVAGADVAWHNGAIDGYSSYFGRADGKGVAVVLLSNSMQFDATAAGRAVLSMALGGEPVAPVSERPVVAVDDAFAGGIVGVYVLSKASRDDLAMKLPKPLLETIESIDIAWEGGALTFKPIGQGRFGLRRAADGPLFNADLKVEITPDLGSAKKPLKKAKGVTLNQGSISAVYIRKK